jgi:hypothetical protein
MTERIDLDDFEADESTAEDAKPRGSWFWEGDGDPDDEVDPWTGRTDDAATADADADAATATTHDEHAVGTDVDRADDADHEAGPDDADTDTDGAVARDPIPRVPRTNEDRPVGIPMESGGAGGTFAGADSDESAEAADSASDATPTAGAETDGASTDEAAATAGAASSPEPSGPHGGGVDEMTLAFTYNAITRLSHLHGALADANEWTDWIGLVGDVEAYVINKFQRDNHLDLDFFNGSGTGPGERLAEIGEHSMFYAERMVVVGVAGEDEDVAEEAGWEFIPLEDAAAKAGWELDD